MVFPLQFKYTSEKPWFHTWYVLCQKWWGMNHLWQILFWYSCPEIIFRSAVTIRPSTLYNSTLYNRPSTLYQSNLLKHRPSFECHIAMVSWERQISSEPSRTRDIKLKLHALQQGHGQAICILKTATQLAIVGQCFDWHVCETGSSKCWPKPKVRYKLWVSKRSWWHCIHRNEGQCSNIGKHNLHFWKELSTHVWHRHFEKPNMQVLPFQV